MRRLPACSSGTARRTTSSCSLTPTARCGPRTGWTGGSSAGSATGGPGSVGAACCASAAACTCRTPRRCWARTWRAASGSWTTAMLTGPPRRCVATGSGSSSTCWSAKACSTGRPARPACSSARAGDRVAWEPPPTAATGWTWVPRGSSAPGRPRKPEVSGAVFSGLAVSMGNPHLACLTDTDIDALDLTGTPSVDPALFPDGVNVELVDVLETAAHIRLRVVERGVGETRSCGTGPCAAAYAALAAEGRSEGTVLVDVPGGRLSVQVTPGTTVLTGPAVLVSAGALCPEWLAG